MPRSLTRPLLPALVLLAAAMLLPPQATALLESAVLTAAERHASIPGTARTAPHLPPAEAG
jgi:hypothetical protein